MWVNVFGEPPRRLADCLIELSFKFLIGKSRRVVDRGIRLLDCCGFFEKVHNLFELVF